MRHSPQFLVHVQGLPKKKLSKLLSKERKQVYISMDRLVEEDFIRSRVSRRYTHRQISEEIQRLFPDERGLSEMSVRRYCTERNIHYSSRLNDDQLDDAVRACVQQVILFIYSFM